ncbi:GNAT family N-acetyltransferase [Citromicrobium bathyomarinum]|uniref:GNAT family N-acetyltransferase n=1 Tax=Alteriqipengyuania abyssalis TaxID=2860200 RepID=A0ABS7PK70_9SPHN|nr:MULTISPECIES: bifunctional GNAT family N-acetyltransferase/carbon-nitrogen hydrolase family protein [Sphingomonadales]MBY8338242.1 GNAT family N-acetyltransferase [Alteriqipengyuania abyssalis]MCD1621788.1 GNAT family N-acetyltransferase [Citromicrobium bathyomarinum]ALG61776.1 carbon-nitrogen hydrolase [Citromicrobium sp. JL477]KPM12438.1 carbon-nitrogen hydrolase [Citromicrobium sp. JL1351]KPM16671.1 carbon-nitrogen hydrolase [Citromicrobium sp. JL31]
MSTTDKTKARLEVRQAKLKDVPDIAELVRRAYVDLPPYKLGEIRGQLNNYREGCFVAKLDGVIVGYCASMRLKANVAMSDHSWDEVTGNGFGSRHDPTGDWLYGYEMCVDPKVRGTRIGRRLYEERRALAERLDLSGIVFGGRMPNLANAMRRKRNRAEGPEDYLEKVVDNKIHDPVLRFQLANGFEPQGILENYLPEDKRSKAFAVRMVWRNPYVDADAPRKHRLPRDVESVRIATCQLQARAVSGFDEFMRHVEYFVDVASDYESDFILFPELFTLMLLSAEEKELSPIEAIEALSEYTPKIRQKLSELALNYNINIIGGSHPTRMDDGDIHNVAYVCLRDGSIHAQEKIHPTPNEAYWWNIKGGDSIDAIPTDCGPIGVLICYDSEFPELARRLVDEGARIIFVPFCTDSRQGYMRVRYCAQARAIENQCFTVLSGNVGNLPNVANMDIQYAQSCILTPCDFPFARDGIAAEASENVETLTISDVNLADLSWARAEGTVRNLADRRFDLYQIEWDKRVGQISPRIGEAEAEAAGQDAAPRGPHTPGGG